MYCNIFFFLCLIINCSIGLENYIGIVYFKMLEILNMMVYIKLIYSFCYFYLYNLCLFVLVIGISNEYIVDENLIYFFVNKMLIMNDKCMFNLINIKILNFY